MSFCLVAPSPTKAGDISDGEKSDRLCGICEESVINCRGEEVEALFCGHVFHTSCISKVWTVGNWPRGSCPYRCRPVLESIEVPASNRVDPDQHAADGWEVIDNDENALNPEMIGPIRVDSGVAAESSSGSLTPGSGMLL